jgi:hypothetical protein
MSIAKTRYFEMNFIIFMFQHDSAKFYLHCIVSKNVSCTFIYWTEGIVMLPTCVRSQLVVFFMKRGISRVQNLE